MQNSSISIGVLFINYIWNFTNSWWK